MTTDDGRRGFADDCPPDRVAACAAEMERASHDMARKILVTLLAVDIDDAKSVEEFQNRRRRDADLHRSRNDEAVVEHGDQRHRLGEQVQVLQLARPHVGDEDADQSRPDEDRADQMDEAKKQKIHDLGLPCRP
jgi:hypothetical protein